MEMAGPSAPSLFILPKPVNNQITADEHAELFSRL